MIYKKDIYTTVVVKYNNSSDVEPNSFSWSSFRLRRISIITIKETDNFKTHAFIIALQK